jgi:hypothetical protein
VNTKSANTFTVSAQLLDSFGQQVSNDSGTPISIALAQNPTGGTLSCSSGTTVPDVNGVSTFTGCSISASPTSIANGYQLVASSSGLASGNSYLFNITK